MFNSFKQFLIAAAQILTVIVSTVAALLQALEMYYKNKETMNGQHI